MRHPFFDLPTPVVFGHRGASGEAPANTLPAFERAVAQGAAVLETDVHLTRDGVVVTFHDDDLARTTDATGPIAELSFDELRRLDAGHRFSPDGGRSFPFRGQGVQVPRLRDVLEAFPDVRLNVEIKRSDPRLVDTALREIADAGREKTTLLAAGEDATMALLRRRLADTRLGVAQGASPADVVGFVRAMLAGTAPPQEPMALQIPPGFAGQPLVTPALVAFAHQHGVQIHVWTLNERSELERLLDLGVDGVMSDFPALACEVVAERRARR
jgi:glycerophosphoryl diester phosphodiesterase